MAVETLTFSQVGNAHRATLTVTKPVKIHIENAGGHSTISAKLDGATRYEEIKGASWDGDTFCRTLTDEVFPFDILIVCETKPSLAKYEFAE